MVLYTRVRVVLLAVVFAGLVGACVTTTAPHNLSVENVRALRLERVDVVLDPAASISWPGLETAQAQMQARVRPVSTESDLTGAVPEVTETPRLSPEQMKAKAAAELREKARMVIEPALKSTLNGTKPVNARVTVHHVRVEGALEGFAKTMIIGHGAWQSGMSVSVDFVDARSGAVLLSYPRTGLITDGGYKLNMGTTGAISHDPIERLFTSLNDRLASWLLKA